MTDVHHGAKAKKTMGDMFKLCHVLQLHQPEHVHRRALEDVTAQYSSIELRDAWGNDFLVIRTPGTGDQKAVYSVRSLGKDGKKGACCKEWVGDFNDDALVENLEWKQRWRH